MKRYVNFINEKLNSDERIHSDINLSHDDVMIIANELGYSEIHKTGSGGFGSAYTVDDPTKILKITGDDSEAFNANFLRSRNTTHLVNYYDVRQIRKYVNPKYSLLYKYTSIHYAIVMDKVIKLSDVDYEIFNRTDLRDIVEKPMNIISFEYFITTNFSYRMSQKGFQPDEYFDEFINELTDKIRIACCSSILNRDIVIKRGEFFFKQLVELKEEARKLKVPLDDVAARNLGSKYIDDKEILVAFDIGVMKTKRKNKKLKSIILPTEQNQDDE